MTQAVPLVLHAAPAAGFDEPFEMLAACHERVQRMLRLLRRLAAHLGEHGADAQAAQAAVDVMRYFDEAAPRHHDDEELHVLPRLREQGQAGLADRLHAQHVAMHAAWARLREDLADVAAGRPPAGAHADFVARGEAFAAMYDEHIPLEDGQAYPQARAALDAAALQAMSADMAARRGLR